MKLVPGHGGGDGGREPSEGDRSRPGGNAQLPLGVHWIAEAVSAGGEEAVEEVGLL